MRAKVDIPPTRDARRERGIQIREELRRRAEQREIDRVELEEMQRRYKDRLALIRLAQGK